MELATTIIIAFTSSLATGFGTWFFYRKKYKAETVSVEISNYRMIIEDLKKAAEDWQGQAEKYRGLYMNSTIEIDQLKSQIRTLQSEVKSHKSDIEKLKKQ